MPVPDSKTNENIADKNDEERQDVTAEEDGADEVGLLRLEVGPQLVTHLHLLQRRPVLELSVVHRPRHRDRQGDEPRDKDRHFTVLDAYPSFWGLTDRQIPTKQK